MKPETSKPETPSEPVIPDKDYEYKMMDHGLKLLDVVLATYARLILVFFVMLAGFVLAVGQGVISGHGMLGLQAIGVVLAVVLAGLTLGAIMLIQRLLTDYLSRLSRVLDVDMLARFEGKRRRLGQALRLVKLGGVVFFAVVAAVFVLA